MDGFGRHRYLVTGGASGIGAAVADRLAGRGDAVTVLDLQTPAEAGGPIRYVQGSVADESAVRRAVEIAAGEEGRLRGLVNNAGRLYHAAVDRVEFDDWRAMLDVNVGGYLLAAKHAFAPMKQAGGGAIVNCASIMAYNSARGAAAYSASKAGVLGLTRATALDGAAHGIRCNSVCPGTIDTPMYRRYLEDKPDPKAEHERIQAMYPLGRIGTAQDVASLILFLLGRESSWITGQDFVIDGGFLAQGTND
jgi:NAD(P)-dependent dehydrogenase (short-subunit alcohol dehydrogenase family)